MTPFLYALNIGTLATWLSVAGFGVVGIFWPVGGRGEPVVEVLSEPFDGQEPTLLLDAFTLEEPRDEVPGVVENEAEAIPEESDAMPAPPEMPEVREIMPLPELPAMTSRPKAVSQTAPPPVRRESRPVRKASPSASATPAPKPQRAQSAVGSGTAQSDAQRLSSGRMPPPTYPAAARAKGQTGTVVVQFVVNEAGKVVSASLKSPSPWPLLNERALSCVRRWSFPPGRVTQYVRPITFKLN